MERKLAVIMCFCGKFRAVREFDEGGRVFGYLRRPELRGGDFWTLWAQTYSEEWRRRAAARIFLRSCREISLIFAF